VTTSSARVSRCARGFTPARSRSANRDIAGIAVHIGARVSELAGAGEVLVTRTVRDLVAGSGIAFDDRGEFPLKGVPERWELYATAN
jgi:class 3 adenylate cyclase